MSWEVWTRNDVLSALSTTEPSENQRSGWRERLPSSFAPTWTNLVSTSVGTNSGWSLCIACWWERRSRVQMAQVRATTANA